MTSTSCVSVSLYNESLIVFLNCKSLWIKVSAKLINIKCMITFQKVNKITNYFKTAHAPWGITLI